MKKLITVITLLSSALLYSADFDLVLKSGSRTNLSDEGLFKTKSIPSFDDNLNVKPHSYTENYSLYFDFPGNTTGNFGFKTLNLEVENSLGIAILVNTGLFEIKGDFIKQAQTKEDKSNMVAKGENANISVFPYYGDSSVSFKLDGNMRLIDMATNRTSATYFGAYTTTGEFRNKSFFDSFEILGDLELTNQKFAVSTKDGKNATIKGLVKFDSASPERSGVLILNNDAMPEAKLLSQTTRVGGLVSVKPGAGIVSTSTDARKYVDLKEGDQQDSKDPLGKKLVGDEVIREGTIEIIGEGGDFSGEIKDNWLSKDKRGRVNLTMDSPNGKQILSGKVTYTGVTTLKSGELILSGTSPIGDLKIMGGTLGFLSDTLQVKDLMWSSGGFVFDFTKNKTISVSGQMNVSVIPEALDVFTFKNITPRKAYTIFSFENKKDALSTFVGKKLEYTDAATNKVYNALFGTSDTALTVVFLPKE